jgi:hypothetical protein
MNDYTQAPATKMLATNCICCGRSLVDARSVSMGIGPECVKHIDADATGGIDEGTRQVANEYVFDAAIAAQTGNVSEVMRCADVIESMGLTTLAGKVRNRFKKALTRKTNITITVENDYFKVKTPFRRGDKKAFIKAWRKIPGRRYSNQSNFIPVAQKAALWKLLREFFGGKYGTGPKGVFRIPKPEPKPVQLDLGMDPGNQAECDLARSEMGLS